MSTDQSYDEKALLARIADGDEAAFATFFHNYSGTLYHFVLKHNNDEQLADDLVQEIFTKLWLTRESLPAIGNIRSYLFIIARNYAIDVLRKTIRDHKKHIEWQQSLDEDSDEAEREIYLSIIDKAIEQLPEQQRKTWTLSRRYNRKYAEIAQELGVSRETVKTNLQLANAGISRYVLANADLAALLILLKFI